MALGSGVLLIGNITGNSLFQFKLGAIGDIGFLLTISLPYIILLVFIPALFGVFSDKKSKWYRYYWILNSITVISASLYIVKDFSENSRLLADLVLSNKWYGLWVLLALITIMLNYYTQRNK
jgi:hypothetical protein